MSPCRKRWLALTVLAVTAAVLLLPAGGALLPGAPGAVGQLLQYALWLVPPLAALLAWHGPSADRLRRELGLAGDGPSGLGWASVAAGPYVVAALLVASPGVLTALAVAESALVVAALEGVLFRGFLFGQLFSRAGWGFLPAVAAGPLLIALTGSGDPAAVPGGLVANVFLAWLWLEWDDNLWVSAGFHFWIRWGDAFLLPAAGPSLHWLVQLMQLAAVVWAVALTWGHRRSRGGFRIDRRRLLRNPRPAGG
jgi:membrane protease YdiL (CAAX protease family)